MADLYPGKLRLLVDALLLAALAVASNPLRCQESEAPAGLLSGTWQGGVSTLGFDLTVAVHLGQDRDGGATATCDLVDYRDMGRKASGVQVSGRSVQFSLEWASFEGAVDGDGNLRGTWTQGLRKIAVTLRPTPAVVVPKRPQEPHGSLPYDAHDVAYHYDAGTGVESLQAGASARQGTISLAATMTVPRSVGPHPAIVLVSGSGPDTRDAPIMGHRLFLVLADYLTRRGFAVLRYDERGCGQSTGEFADANLQALALDVRAGVRFLRQRKEIDATRIGLVGHSEGGLVASIAAGSEDAAWIHFVVSLAGPAMAAEELLSRQFRALNRLRGMKQTDIELLDEMLHRQCEIVRGGKDAEDRRDKIVKAVHATWARLSADGRGHASGYIGNLMASALRSNSPKFHAWITHDVGATLRAVTCPMLVLVGSKDLQVEPRGNLSAARAALADNADATIRELSGLNHLFQQCATGSYTEYAMIEQTMSPLALETIGDWLRARFQNR